MAAIHASYSNVCRIFSGNNASQGLTQTVWQFSENITLCLQEEKLIWKLSDQTSYVFCDSKNCTFNSEAEKAPQTDLIKEIQKYEYGIYETMWKLRGGGDREDEFGRKQFRNHSMLSDKITAVDGYLEKLRICTVTEDKKELHALDFGNRLMIIALDHSTEQVRMTSLRQNVAQKRNYFFSSIVRLKPAFPFPTITPATKMWVFNRVVQLFQGQDNGKEQLVWRIFNEKRKQIWFFTFLNLQTPQTHFSEAEISKESLQSYEHNLYKWTWALSSKTKRPSQIPMNTFSSSSATSTVTTLDSTDPEFGRKQFRSQGFDRAAIIDRYIQSHKILEWRCHHKTVTLIDTGNTLEVEIQDDGSKGLRHAYEQNGKSVDQCISELVFSSIHINDKTFPIFNFAQDPIEKLVVSYKAQLFYNNEHGIWRLYDEPTGVISWIEHKSFRQGFYPKLLKKSTEVFTEDNDQRVFQQVCKEFQISEAFSIYELENKCSFRAKTVFNTNHIDREFLLMQFGNGLELISVKNKSSFKLLSHPNVDDKRNLELYRLGYFVTSNDDGSPALTPIEDSCVVRPNESLKPPLKTSVWNMVKFKSKQNDAWYFRECIYNNPKELDNVNFFNIYGWSSLERITKIKDFQERDKFCKNFQVRKDGKYLPQFTLEKITFASHANGKMSVDCDNYVITLASVKPQHTTTNNLTGHIFGHAVIYIEGVKEGNHFCTMTHLTAVGASKGYAKVEEIENAKFRVSKGIVWQKSQTVCQTMLSKIHQDKKKQIRFKIINPQQENPEEINCLYWAIETLRFVGLNLAYPESSIMTPEAYIDKLLRI